jgi:hypothetical protein
MHTKGDDHGVLIIGSKLSYTCGHAHASASFKLGGRRRRAEQCSRTSAFVQQLTLHACMYTHPADQPAVRPLATASAWQRYVRYLASSICQEIQTRRTHTPTRQHLTRITLSVLKSRHYMYVRDIFPKIQNILIN